MKSNHKDVKKLNKNKVRTVLRNRKSTTKAIIAQETGLTVVTIQSLLKELMVEKEVIKGTLTPSTGGRPASSFVYNQNFKLGLVVLLREYEGEDYLFLDVIDLFGDSIFNEVIKSPNYYYVDILYAIESVLNQFRAIVTIGIGIPGQSDHGIITVSSHELLKNVNLITKVEDACKLPTFLINDINAAIYGFSYLKPTYRKSSLIGIYFPKKSPPGMGIMHKGLIVEGKNGMAGEIKYLPIQVDWDKLSEAKEADFIKVFCQVMHIINVVLAPEVSVIYQDLISSETLSKEWADYCQRNEMPSTPFLTFSNEFHTDFYEGVKLNTLKRIIYQIEKV